MSLFLACCLLWKIPAFSGHHQPKTGFSFVPKNCMSDQIVEDTIPASSTTRWDGRQSDRTVKEVQTPQATRVNPSAGAATDAASWMPLLVAGIFLPFADGGQSIWLAAWLAPLFLLRFTRTHKRIVALPVALVVQAAAIAIQFRGMLPFPTLIEVAVILIYAFARTVPYLGDHLSIQRLTGFSRSFVFPVLWSAIEFLISLGPF